MKKDELGLLRCFLRSESVRRSKHRQNLCGGRGEEKRDGKREKTRLK